jgi:hypothetical protein
MTKQEKNIALSKWEGFNPWWDCVVHREVSADRIVAATNGPTCPWCGSTLDLRECADYFEQAEPLRRLKNRLDKEQKISFLTLLFNHLIGEERNDASLKTLDFWPLFNAPSDVQIDIIGCQILKFWESDK